jgi:diguanylate cyclase (GGDEF)-like protein/PAS domain S-box-containing protein
MSQPRPKRGDVDISLAVLIIEDSESDAQFIVRLLNKSGYEVVFERVETAEQMLHALDRQPWDIVISDYRLPQFDGHAALELLKEKQLDIPFIVVSGAMGEECAVAMMKAGAHDYLIKDKLSRLAPAVGRELEQSGIRRERKQAEQGLRESEERYRMLVEQASDWIFITDSDGKYLEVNSAGCKMLGYTRDEIMQLTMHDITKFPSEKSLHFNELQEGDASISECELICKDGSLKYVEISARQLPDGRLQGIARDMTERKRVEDKLRHLSRAVENSPASIVITDINGRIEYVNPKYTAMTGFAFDDVLGKTSPNTFGSGEAHSEIHSEHWQISGSAREWHGEMLNRKKNGASYWEAVSISPITDLNGTITHLIIVTEDITARKEAEEKIKRLNAGLEELAMTDYLTNLYNRRYFMQRGEEDLKRTKRSNQPLALLMMDIDEFKNVNDTYGHEAGDMALQQVAAALKSSLREVDILGRMGGEEFAVLLPNTSLVEAVPLAERVRHVIAATPIEILSGDSHITITITISMGVAAFTKEISTIDDLLRNADAALYQAKRNGRNRVIKYQTFSEEARSIASGMEG